MTTPFGIFKHRLSGTLGSEIRKYRTSARLTLRDLAKLSSRTTSHLNQIEHSRTSPSASTIHTLERVFELTPGTLFAHTGQPMMDLTRSIIDTSPIRPIIFPYRINVTKDELIHSIATDLSNARFRIRDKLLEF